MKYAKPILGFLILAIFVSITLVGRSNAKDKSAISPSDLALQVNSVNTLQPANSAQKITIPSVNVTLTPIPTQHAEQDISADEKQAIDSWIKKNNLNEYGDTKETMYAGGNPLFNEATGQTTDRYVYILKKHPDHPWEK